MDVKQRLSAEDLWAMPEMPGAHFELADGELVEVSGSGGVHGLIAGLIYRLLFDFAVRHNLGVASGDNVGYVLRRDPDVVRIPDASFVSWERVPAGGVPEGFWPIAPDLAVEVVSPGDRAEDVYAKVHEYLAAGSQAVWVLWPRAHAVTVYTPAGEVRDLGAGDALEGDGVLPGFSVPVDDLFAVRRSRE